MYSQEELISAVCAVGRDGKTFTVKDVRTQLGFETRDKKEISRFRRRLRAFEKTAAEQLEKLGDNSYRLRPGAFEQAALDSTPPSAAASAPELDLEPTTGVFETALPANQTAAASTPQAVHQTVPQPTAAEPARPSAAADRSASVPQRALGLATALVSSALSTSAAVSSKVRERSRNLREQLWSCLGAVPLKRHAIARLQGWAEGLKPLSNEVLEQLQKLAPAASRSHWLHALRQRVSSIRRRAA
jgi:hypothetical protein